MKVEANVLMKGVKSNPFGSVLKGTLIFCDFCEYFLMISFSVYICWEILTGAEHRNRACLNDLTHDSGEHTCQEFVCRRFAYHLNYFPKRCLKKIHSVSVDVQTSCTKFYPLLGNLVGFLFHILKILTTITC